MRFRWWLWPNVLSLDAPLVAVLWDLLFAQAFHARVSSAAVATLGLWVWVIYASDRVLDSFAPLVKVEPTRHQFYRRYRIEMAPIIAVGAITALWLTFAQLRFRLLLYGLPLGLLMAGYFAIVHLGPRWLNERWPKELAVAVLFGIGTLLPVAANLPNRAVLAPAAIPFGAILWINIVAIDRWETESLTSRGAMANVMRRFCLSNYLVACSAIVTLAAIALILADYGSGADAVYLAIALSAILLGTLASLRGRFSGDALRVLADAALLSPLCFLWLR